MAFCPDTAIGWLGVCLLTVVFRSFQAPAFAPRARLQPPQGRAFLALRKARCSHAAACMRALPREALEAAAQPTPWETLAAESSGSRSAVDPAAALDFPALQSDPVSETVTPAASTAGRAAVDAERWADQLEETTALLAAAGLGDDALRQTLLPGLPQLPRLAPPAVAAAMAFLEDVLGSRDEAVAAVLEEPSLLACDVEEHLAPAMEFLQTMAGAGDAAEAGRMVAQSAGLLRWAVEGSLRERQLQAAMRTASAGNAASAVALAQGIRDVRAARGL